MTVELPRLSDLSPGPESEDSPLSSSDSGPIGDLDIDERAREDAGGRAMDAIKTGDTKAFIRAMRDLAPFLKD